MLDKLISFWLQLGTWLGTCIGADQAAPLIKLGTSIDSTVLTHAMVSCTWHRCGLSQPTKHTKQPPKQPTSTSQATN